MKFYLKKIVLWLDNGYKRELGEFENNKVNIIRTEADTFETAKMIGLSNYVKNLIY